jgi:5'-nucleotidase/UDP-sugar diphosphatase
VEPPGPGAAAPPPRRRARRAAAAAALLLLPPADAGPGEPPAGAAAPPAAARIARVLLLHTNDLHGQVGRAPALAALARSLGSDGPDALWLDAGDAVGGTPASSATRGLAAFEVASLMGVDAACLGNHEFDHGFERIAAFRAAASFPLLCANARAPSGDLLGDAPWWTTTAGGARVGVIGVVTEHAGLQTARRGNEGVSFEPAREALLRGVAALRPRCDLVVALTHCGFDADLALAATVPGLDVVVGGHSHTDLPGPVRVGRAVVVQAGAQGLRLGVLRLGVDLDRGGLATSEGETREVDPGGPADPATARRASALEAAAESGLGEVLARATRTLDRAAVRRLAEEAMVKATGADLGWQNDGGVRAELREGPLTLRDAWAAFPFENTVVVVRVPGARLPAALRERLGGRADAKRIYRVAVNSFLADHGERFLPGALPDPEDTGVPVREAVAALLRARGRVP